MENNNISQKSRINPFSFNGKSGQLNFLIYGILPITIVFILGFYIHNPIIMGILSILAVAIFFATLTRRGRDAGLSPLSSIGGYIVSALLISTLMSETPISLKILSMFESKTVGLVIMALITNVYLIYLFMLPKSDKEIPETSLLGKIILGFLGVVILGAFGASVIIPMMNH